jgi:hypothetical protein
MSLEQSDPKVRDSTHSPDGQAHLRQAVLDPRRVKIEVQRNKLDGVAVAGIPTLPVEQIPQNSLEVTLVGKLQYQHALGGQDL